MPDAIWNYIFNHYPIIAIGLFILLIVGFIVWKFAIFYSRTQNAIQEVPDIKKTLLKISGMGSDVENIKKDIEKIQPDLKEVREKVSGMVPQIEKLWQEVFAQRQQPLVESHSPLSLSDKGKKLLEDSKINNIVDSDKDNLCKAIKEKNPQTAYDVQEFAKEVMLPIMKDQKIAKELKIKAYNLGVGVEDILFVGSIYLRDIALEECGFSPDDLDKK